MNNGQRAQINFLEQLTFIIGTTLIATLDNTCCWISFGLIIAFFFGRILFSIGYTKFGPNARLPGALIMDLVILS